MNIYHPGTCPSCKETFNAQEAEYAFPLRIKDKKISLIFGFCPKCISKIINSNDSEQKEIANSAVANIFADAARNWTVTSNLALKFHNDDFYDAWSIGVEIPPELFNLINDGHIDTLTFLPGGATWR